MGRSGHRHRVSGTSRSPVWGTLILLAIITLAALPAQAADPAVSKALRVHTNARRLLNKHRELGKGRTPRVLELRGGDNDAKKIMRRPSLHPLLKPWKVFDQDGNLNGPWFNVHPKTEAYRERTLEPEESLMHQWDKPLATAWGWEFSPNPPNLQLPPRAWLQAWDYNEFGLPPGEDRRWFFTERRSDHLFTLHTRFNPQKRDQIQEIHMFWKRIYSIFFGCGDTPGNHIECDADVPVSGVDRPDAFGNMFNWTAMYEQLPWQDELEEMKEKELDDYEIFLVKRLLRKISHWTIFLATLWLVIRRHPRNSGYRKFKGLPLGAHLSAPEQMWAYKEGMIGIEELDFRRLNFVDFYNPRYDASPLQKMDVKEYDNNRWNFITENG